MILRRLFEGLLLFGTALPYVTVLLIAAHRHGGFGLGFDLHVFWEAARAVGHGTSPYDPAAAAHARQLAQAHPGAPVGSNHLAVYPPALYVALIPLGWLPWAVAGMVGMLALAVTPGLALRVMGVRDWRCYCLMYASAPILTSIFLGAISSALMLGFAIVWRGRGVVLAGAATIAAKLFLWPLALVVAAVDGVRRATLMVACAVGIIAASWAVIAFADIQRYPTILSDLSEAEAHNSFSATGFASALGASPAVGTYAGLLLGLAVAGLAFRRGRLGDRDAAFTLALVAAFLASPIVWSHYLVLLFLPLAARFRRANALWFLPLALWPYMQQAANGHPWAFAGSWTCLTVIAVASLRHDRARSRISIAAPASLLSIDRGDPA
jgi:alpha-1,2-mannosyltransferase